MRKLRDELRERYPGLAANPAPRAAIKLFCIECMGGVHRDAATCGEQDCPLWPHWKQRVQRSLGERDADSESGAAMSGGAGTPRVDKPARTAEKRPRERPAT